MATTNVTETRSVSKIGVLRFSLTGALASGVFFLLCWLGAFLPVGPATHMYLQLFTNAELTSGLALVQGLCWPVVFGLVAGALVAVAYNMLAMVDVR